MRMMCRMMHAMDHSARKQNQTTARDGRAGYVAVGRHGAVGAGKMVGM